MIESSAIADTHPCIAEIVEPVVGIKPVLLTSSEKLGDFPGVADLEEHDGQAVLVVQYHEPTFSALQSDYCEDGMTEDGFHSVYFMTSIVNFAAREHVGHHDVTKISEIHRTLNNSDSLARHVYENENDELNTDQVNFLLAAIREDWIAPHLTQLNALRFSLGVVSVTGICEKEVMDSFQYKSTKLLIQTLVTERKKYEAVLEGFGETSLERKARLFAGAIPIVQLAGAYPLSQAETEQLAYELT